MAGKNHLLIAKEGTFGEAPASGYVGVAVEDLGGHEPDVMVRQPSVMVYGQHGPTTVGRRNVEGMWNGAIKTYLGSSGIGLLLGGIFGAPVTTELVADEAYQHVFTTNDTLSPWSFATQVAREFKSGSLDRDTLVGGQMGEMTLTQAMLGGAGTSDEGLTKVEFAMNYKRRDSTVAAKTPVYADPELYYSGGDHKLWVGPSLDEEDLVEKCLMAWTLKVPTGADFDPDCIGTTNRDKAARGALPEPTIEAGWSYKGREFFDAYLNGTILAVRSRWEPTGVEISDGIAPSVTVDVPAIGLNGKVPQEQKDKSTKQDLGMNVLWNTVDPMITVTVISSEPTIG